MKTKDFIKMLQKEDPSGEGYVRIGGGAIIFAETKLGYWDGPYEYKDENDVLVSSIQGYKIDIHTESMEDIVWECDGDMDKVREKIRFEYQGYLDKGEKRINDIWKSLEKKAEYVREKHQESLKNYTEKIIKRYKKDDFIIEKINEEHPLLMTNFSWKHGEKLSICGGEYDVIFDTDLFEKVDYKKGYYKLKIK